MPIRKGHPACTSCRQMKLRCDTQDTFPASCTRCTKRSLNCVQDAGFRRVAKRQRARAVEEELQQIKGIAAAPTLQATSTTAPGSASTGAQPPERQLYHEAAPPPSNRLPAQDIGGVKLSSDVVTELCGLYYAEYNCMLPILPEIQSYAASAESCPLLLSLIVALASQCTPTYTTLRARLAPTIRKLALDVEASTRSPLYTVQALLILCSWPLESEPTSTNPSWTYCGIATHTALRFGLHEPRRVGDFRYRETVDEAVSAVRARTWAACVVVNQTLSSYLGIPATIPPLPANRISAQADVTVLPTILQQHLDVARLDHEVCKLLGSYDGEQSGLCQELAALIGNFDRQYQRSSAMAGDNSPAFLRVAILKGRLNLGSILAAACFTSGVDLPPWAIHHLAQALRLAAALIQAASLIDSMFWPSSVPLGIYSAVFFLLKVSASHWDFVDQLMAKNAIRKAWSLLRSASRSKHDQFDRVCSVIEYMSTVGVTAPRYATSMSVRSRMASNLVYDTIFTAKDRFDQRVRDTGALDLTLAAEKDGQLHAFEGGDDLTWDALLDFPYLDTISGFDFEPNAVHGADTQQ